MPSVLSTLKRRRDELKDDKTLLERAKPEVFVTPEIEELDALRDESAELVRDNKRRKFTNDQLQAVEDAAFIERQKLDPKCIYPRNGDFSKLCQKGIPEDYGAALLCADHNSKCTPGVKDSVLKKALSKYRHGKKDQQTAFSVLASLRQQAQGVATAVDNVANGMTQLAVQQPQAQPLQPQVVKREQTLDIKVERPKLTVEQLEAMKESIEIDAKEQRRLAKDYYNITNRLSLKAKVEDVGIVSAIGALKKVVDPDNTLAADKVLPAMRKVVEDMRAQRRRELDRARRAPVQPPRPAGVKAQ